MNTTILMFLCAALTVVALLLGVCLKDYMYRVKVLQVRIKNMNEANLDHWINNKTLNERIRGYCADIENLRAQSYPREHPVLGEAPAGTVALFADKIRRVQE